MAVTFGKLHYRNLERDKIFALRKNMGKFDSPMIISHQARRDIHWWINNIDKSYSDISKNNSRFVMTTDACQTGWGAVCPWARTSGLFSEEETDFHINVLELKAIYFGLKSLCGDLRDTHIKVLSDNTTAVQCVLNMGSCVSVECDSVTKAIWEWVIDTNNWITLSHIPGIENVEADLESRKNETQIEWQLDKNLFQNILEHFCVELSIDMFASRINIQLPRFVSFRHDPEAIHVNAFTIDWNNEKFYCFPPFSCILRVIQEVIRDRAEGILVVPNWPNQVWFPILYDILICEPLLFPPRKSNLLLPNRSQEIHPLHSHLELLACHVSGRL